MDDYLSKPLRREQLEACLERWLGSNEASPRAANDAGVTAG
jgi:YesN/AraC family two-component response regulator